MFQICLSYLPHGCVRLISVEGNVKHFVVEETHVFRGELCSGGLTQGLVQTSDTILGEDMRTLGLLYKWKTVPNQHQNFLPAPCFHHCGLMNYTGCYYGYSCPLEKTAGSGYQARKVTVSVRGRRRGVKCDAYDV